MHTRYKCYVKTKKNIIRNDHRSENDGDDDTDVHKIDEN